MIQPAAMKKIDLIHTTLLIIALLAGYNALVSLIGYVHP